MTRFPGGTARKRKYAPGIKSMRSPRRMPGPSIDRTNKTPPMPCGMRGVITRFHSRLSLSGNNRAGLNAAVRDGISSVRGSGTHFTLLPATPLTATGGVSLHRTLDRVFHFTALYYHAPAAVSIAAGLFSSAEQLAAAAEVHRVSTAYSTTATTGDVHFHNSLVIADIAHPDDPEYEAYHGGNDRRGDEQRHAAPAHLLELLARGPSRLCRRRCIRRPRQLGHGYPGRDDHYRAAAVVGNQRERCSAAWTRRCRGSR